MEGRDEVLQTSFDRSIISGLWKLIRNLRKPVDPSENLHLLNLAGNWPKEVRPSIGARNYPNTASILHTNRKSGMTTYY
jgi:hypothetical protein